SATSSDLLPPSDPDLPHPRDRLGGEDDRPRVRPEEAGDQVEERRLAGAVGADQPGDGALLDLQRARVDGDDAAERPAEPADLEQAHRDAASPVGEPDPSPVPRLRDLAALADSSRSAIEGMIPFGSRRITARKTAAY